MEKTAAILLGILCVMFFTAGCVSTGAEPVQSTPAPEQVQSTPEQLTMDNSSVNCTVVTQYGGRVISCYGNIGVEEKEQAVQGVGGKWKVVYGNLSVFPSLHFTGVAEFDPKGTYIISVHPEEFDPTEGRIVYTGSYRIEDGSIIGSGESKIYKKGELFGNPAKDRLHASVSGRRIEGEIESFTGFHTGGGAEEKAVLSFVLESG